MDDEITIELNGSSYTVLYSIDGEELRLYFPDGQQRITMLGGLTIESAIRPHLVSYLKQHPDYST